MSFLQTPIQALRFAPGLKASPFELYLTEFADRSQFSPESRILIQAHTQKYITMSDSL
jgi:hypothetical protein